MTALAIEQAALTFKTAQCQDCGKVLEYRTKKPMRCPECNELLYGDRKFYYRPRHGYIRRSHGENLMRVLLNSIFKDDCWYIDGGYYNFLKSPRGYELQLDRYYPNLALAFEYHGKQHDEDNTYFFRDGQFEYLQECDRLKEDLCAKFGITLIRIYHDEPLSVGLILSKLAHANLYLNLKPYFKYEAAGIAM